MHPKNGLVLQLPLKLIFNKPALLLTIAMMFFSSLFFPLLTDGFVINGYAGLDHIVYVEDLMGIGSKDNIVLFFTAAIALVTLIVMASLPSRYPFIIVIIGLCLLPIQLVPFKLIETSAPSDVFFDTLMHGNSALIVWALSFLMYFVVLTGILMMRLLSGRVEKGN